MKGGELFCSIDERTFLIIIADDGAKTFLLKKMRAQELFPAKK